MHRILYIASRAVSFAFSPLLIPTYGIIVAFCLSFLVLLPWRTIAVVSATTFLITGIMPFAIIFLLWRIRRVSHPALRNRRERLLPYIATICCYLGCMIYLIVLKAPVWLWSFMLGAAVSVLFVMFINLKWKISAHTTAFGGFLAMMFRIAVNGYSPFPLTGCIAVSVLIAGAVATSRLLLRRHSLLQVLSGFVVGFLSVFLISQM